MYLDETNVGSLLAEALTADIETVLADQTGLVGANSAVKKSITLAVIVLLIIHLDLHQFVPPRCS